MPRGRHYYDPEIQYSDPHHRVSQSGLHDHVIGDTDKTRIELFPVGQESTGRLPQEIGKWVARKIEADGTISGYTPGDFDHARALAQAEQTWPGLQVYELRSEIEDSTWEGTGPSPRLWQNSSPETGAATPPGVLVPSAGPSPDLPGSGAGDEQLPPAVEPPTEGQVPLRALPITEPGMYVLLDDIRLLLETWAVAYEVDKNPSAAMALRDAVDALKDVG